MTGVAGPAQTIARVGDRHGVDTAQLVQAFADGERVIAALRATLAARFPHAEVPGVEIVVGGSMAKRQCTRGSDVDFYGICEQPVAPAQRDALLGAVVEQTLALGYDAPFAQGSNGVMVERGELEQVNVVGDDIRRVFRRMSLVNASVSVYRPELRAAVVRGALAGLLGRDRTPRVRGLVDHLVMLARMGNGVAEWRMSDRSADGGLVQWAKCFTLYRVELGSSLVAIFRASREAEGGGRDALVDALARHLEPTPFERLLAWYDELAPAGRDALATLLAVSNDTLRLFGTPGVRPRLVALADDAPTRELRATLEALMARTQQALVQLFYREPAFAPWTEALGLFG